MAEFTYVFGVRNRRSHNKALSVTTFGEECGPMGMEMKSKDKLSHFALLNSLLSEHFTKRMHPG